MNASPSVLTSSSLCRCQNSIELHNGWCYLHGRKGPSLSHSGWMCCGGRLGSPSSYSQSHSKFTAVGLHLCVQCFIPQLVNLQIKIRLYSTMEEFKDTGLLTLFFFLVTYPKWESCMLLCSLLLLVLQKCLPFFSAFTSNYQRCNFVLNE